MNVSFHILSVSCRELSELNKTAYDATVYTDIEKRCGPSSASHFLSRNTSDSHRRCQ
jgi:hypothetical protein